MLRDYIRSLLDKKPSTGKTLAELDGLRGLAVLIVIASHSNAFGMKGQGALGVWLFFVLSGFLLTWILLRTLPGALGPSGLAKYFIRRVARIIPMYYLCLVGVALLERGSLEWLWLHFTFRRARGHFWSIPQEEVFYLLLPVLLASVLFLRRLLRVVPASVIVAVALLVVAIYGPLFSLPGNDSLIRFYLEIFLQGMVIAFLWDSAEPWLQKPTGLAALAFNIASLPVLMAVVFTSPTHHRYFQEILGFSPPQFGWQFPLRSGLACALLLVMTLRRGSWLNRALSLAPLRVLGVLSFGLYLVHPFVIRNLRSEFGIGRGPVLLFATLLISTLIALMLERTVERPCMAFGKKINSKL